MPIWLQPRWDSLSNLMKSRSAHLATEEEEVHLLVEFRCLNFRGCIKMSAAPCSSVNSLLLFN
ncbi:hypothetical protein ACJIZ3_018640 [Penstemon smallii]|uniref:Uncharacterized protein n=1 Tax=Penstemon smallii TaxID=265156 RepID=A0ABD3SZH9_9LAMI